METLFNINPDDILFLDTETTGKDIKGMRYDIDYMHYPRIVEFAWMKNGIMKDYIIKPQDFEIPQQAVGIHGITTEYAISKGLNISVVMDEFIADAITAKYIVAHSVYFDCSVIKSEGKRMAMPFLYSFLEQAISKEKRICTMQKTTKFVGVRRSNGSAKLPTLTELHFKLFGEGFNAHRASTDVLAVSRCFYKLLDLGEIVL